MTVQRTAFGFPFRPRSKRKNASVIFRPTQGLNVGEPPQDLLPGQTPASQNFVQSDGFLTPRSGLSQFENASFGKAVLGAGVLYDKDGFESLVAGSNRTIAFLHPTPNSWSTLSYVRDTSFLTQDDTFSLGGSDFWDVTPVYSLADEEYLAVMAVSGHYPKYFTVGATPATFSDFTFPVSLTSTRGAKGVSVLNDRLFFFHTEGSEGTSFPTRALWSVRGSPKNYSLTDGAGFEDIIAMEGVGTAVVPFRDVGILFTDKEVWVAIPTLDAFAFRFRKISDEIGCPYPKTAVATPLGVVFLGHDKEMYSTDGQSIKNLGQLSQGEPSRIHTELKTKAQELNFTWGVYDTFAQTYGLYYTEGNTNYPNRSLHLNIQNTPSWMKQVFAGHALTYGVDFKSPSLSTVLGLRNVATFGSGGTTYRLLSIQTTDDSTAIDARWRSHGLTQDNQMDQTTMYELWLDYEATSASSYSVYTSNDLGQNFTAVTKLAATATGRNQFVPLWETGQAPQFEIRLNDGGTPKFARFQASLRDAGRFGGAV